MIDKEKLEYAKVWCEQQKQNSGCGTPLYAIIIIAIVLLLSSCTPKTIIEYRDRDVNHYITKVEKDTVTRNTRDSIYFEVVKNGDTVYATKYKEKYIYLDKVQIRCDTCWRDSVVTEYKETIKEVKKVPKIYKISMWIATLSLILLSIKLAKWLKIK